MALLVPDTSPPRLEDRLKVFVYGIVLLAGGALLLWVAPTYADPSWTPSSRRWRYMKNWPPFWRGAQAAIAGSWLLPMSLVCFWKAIRPFTPMDDRRSPTLSDGS